MKAAYFERHGGPEVVRYGDVPDPDAGPGEIVVDIHAASVNGADCKVLSGRYSRITDFPYVLGRDFSGVVGALGDGVDEFAPGDPVYGVCEVGQEGAYAEKIAIKAALAAPKPDSLSHGDASALALIGLTAVVSIEDTLALQPGETILIQGGAGGVAGFGIQLAKHIGARVIATCSAGNVDYVRGLGADEVIDYNAQDFTDAVSDCDAVFETVGGDVAERSFAVLRPGGRAAFIASGLAAPEPCARRRDRAPPARAPRPASLDAYSRAGRGGRRPRAGGPHLPAGGRRRRPRDQRLPPPQGQARPAGSQVTRSRGFYPSAPHSPRPTHVMAGLVPAVHEFFVRWGQRTRPRRFRRNHDGHYSHARAAHRRAQSHGLHIGMRRHEPPRCRPRAQGHQAGHRLSRPRRRECATRHAGRVRHAGRL